jgi:regulator of protease activity HflC (stomatin/prohibitin superfamily)
MFLVILGIVILITVFAFAGANETVRRLRWILLLVGVFCIVFGSGAATFKQIDAGHVGVQKVFGKIQDNVLYEGLSLVNPLAIITDVSIQTQNYTMSAVMDEGQKNGDDAIRVLTADGLEVTIDLTVLYRVQPQDAPRIVRDLGESFEDKIVRPITRTRVRENAVSFNAVDLYSIKRENFQIAIKSAIDKDFRERGFVLEQLLVRNITLPTSVKESIERKITAIQESQRMEYVLDKGRQEAELKRVEARGVADAQTIMGSALNDRVLQYEMIKAQKELATSQNAKIIIMGGKSMPFMLNDK